jgi:predicted helicase
VFKDKELGVVLTPPKTVDYIISRLGPISENSKILDPCVGPGIFIKRLLNFGVNKNQIFTFDINSKYKSEIYHYFQILITILILLLEILLI